MSIPLLEVSNLSVSFGGDAGRVHAVNDVSYTLSEGETLGIVGESGSGKSVHALSMVGLAPDVHGRRVSGSVKFRGQELIGADPAALRRLRGGEIGFVFQDPMTALNPVLSVERQLVELIARHSGLSRRACRARAVELLDMVGIPNPADRVGQFPHQFSGGMRQRVMIALGIACEPKLLIADEATTALDVTVQAQILDLVRDLRERLGTTVIWITHDMGVVAGLADTIQVMYGGRIMERGPVRSVFRDPRSAYTWGLLRSLPQSGQTKSRRLYQIPGQPPNPADLPVGDPFAPRNEFATPRCHLEIPPLQQVDGGAEGHSVAAWYDLRRIRAQQAEGESV